MKSGAKAKTEEKEKERKPTKEEKKKEEDKARRRKDEEKQRNDIANRLRSELGEKGFFLPSSAFRKELQERTRAIRVLHLQDDSSSDDDFELEQVVEQVNMNKKSLEETFLKKGGSGGSRGKRDLSKVAAVMTLRKSNKSWDLAPDESPTKGRRSTSLQPPDSPKGEGRTKRANSLEPSPLLQRKAAWYKFHKTPSSENLIKTAAAEVSSKQDPSAPAAATAPATTTTPHPHSHPPQPHPHHNATQSNPETSLSHSPRESFTPQPQKEKKPKSHRRHNSECPRGISELDTEKQLAKPSDESSKKQKMGRSNSQRNQAEGRQSRPRAATHLQVGSAPEQGYLLEITSKDDTDTDGKKKKKKVKKTKKKEHKRSASVSSSSEQTIKKQEPIASQPQRQKADTTPHAPAEAPPVSPTRSPIAPGSMAPDTNPVKGAPVIEIVSKIGKGSHGVVWKGFIDSKPVALKQVSLEGVKDGRMLRHALKVEVDMMKQIQHPNILKYFGMYYSRATQEVNLVLELMEGGTLSSLIKSVGHVSEQTTAQVVYQTISALKHLKACKVIHRDVKPDNMLLNDEGIVKLCDFGEATQITVEVARRSTVGTPWYCAPEIINGDEYSYASDIWSVGCCIIEMLTGSAPFGEYNPVQALFKMAEEEIPLPQTMSSNCRSFLEQCLQRDWHKRPTPEQLLEHPFLKNVNNHDQIQKLVLQMKEKAEEEPKAPPAEPVQILLSPRSERKNQSAPLPHRSTVSEPTTPTKAPVDSPLKRSQDGKGSKMASAPSKIKGEEEKERKAKEEQERRLKEQERERQLEEQERERKKREEEEKEKERKRKEKAKKREEKEAKKKAKEEKLRREREREKDTEKEQEKKGETNNKGVPSAIEIPPIIPSQEEGSESGDSGRASPPPDSKSVSKALKSPSRRSNIYSDPLLDDVLWNGKKSGDGKASHVTKNLTKSDPPSPSTSMELELGENGKGHHHHKSFSTQTTPSSSPAPSGRRERTLSSKEEPILRQTETSEAVPRTRRSRTVGKDATPSERYIPPSLSLTEATRTTKPTTTHTTTPPTSPPTTPTTPATPKGSGLRTTPDPKPQVVTMFAIKSQTEEEDSYSFG